MDLDQINRVGTAAAYGGGEILRKYFGNISSVRKKGIIDLVTEADLESERKIIASIRKVFPDHSILAEESGHSDGTKDHQWIIDPLDGTTNFAHRLPIYAISIAFAVKGETIMGMVLNPASGEFFTATRCQGARLNGKPIHVSNINRMIDTLLVTGFPYDTADIFEDLMVRFTSCLKATQGIRRLGSAALDLCYVACGWLDGFWEQNLNPWDTAAGALIVSEAGGKVTDFKGQNYQPMKKQILATNTRIHKDMLKLLAIRRTHEDRHVI